MNEQKDITVAEFERNATECIKVCASWFRGYHFLNLRLWFKTEGGEWRPTHKGVTIRPNELNEFEKAVGKAKALLLEKAELRDRG